MNKVFEVPQLKFAFDALEPSVYTGFSTHDADRALTARAQLS